jgi:redox-regulated HSP33 family molecular chaperone
MVESQGLRASAATTEPTPQPADSGHTTLRLTEILLGAAALVTALLAAFFYRKEHL